MNSLKRTIPWICAAFACLVFLISTSAAAMDLTTDIQSNGSGKLTGYVRDNADWDRLVSGKIIVRDASEAGLVLAETDFSANLYDQTYGTRFGDGWHYFEANVSPDAIKGRELSFEIIADEASANTDNAAGPGTSKTSAATDDIPKVSSDSQTSGAPVSSKSAAGSKSADALNAQPEKKSAADGSEVFIASDGTTYRKGSYQGSFKLVGYTGGGHTYSGTKATAFRSVAADTSVLPLGTRIILNGIVYTVEDIGSGVKGKMIDIYFDTYEEAAAVTAKGWTYGDVWIAESVK